MKWSILILTQPTRKFFLARLLRCLEPQVRPHADVEIVIRESDPKMLLGDNRELLRQGSTGEYICFVDDDDTVPKDYVAKIFPLLDGVDYIGFRLQQDNDGRPIPPTFHSLKYFRWSHDSAGFYRDISHLNPMRRELALQVPMSGARGEDQRWSERIRAKVIVRSEHFIDEVMYFYHYRASKIDGGRMR